MINLLYQATFKTTYNIRELTDENLWTISVPEEYRYFFCDKVIIRTTREIFGVSIVSATWVHNESWPNRAAGACAQSLRHAQGPAWSIALPYVHDLLL